MANIKVSEMTEATTFDDGDYTMIVQANQNKKIARENILGDIESNISTISTNIGNLSNLETDDKSNLVNSINELKNAEIYSTDEVKTNKIWINGKPIYRKVINCGALPNNSDKVINVNVSNINNVINIYGIGISSSGTCFPLPYVYNNFNAQIELVYLASSQQIRITTGQDRSGINGYVTIEYTKTTD